MKPDIRITLFVNYHNEKIQESRPTVGFLYGQSLQDCSDLHFADVITC